MAVLIHTKSVQTRRSVLAAGLSLLSACGKPKASGFRGYAFVANKAGAAVAVVDLEAFATIRHIHLNAHPTLLLSLPDANTVLALTPSSGSIHQIDATTLEAKHRVRCGENVSLMRLSARRDLLWLTSQTEPKLIPVSVESLAPRAPIRLPHPAADLDITPHLELAAVSLGRTGQLAIVDLVHRRLIRVLRIGDSCGLVRFRSDGRVILAANPEGRVLSIIDSFSGDVIVHLPLPVRPENLCFKPDGGQLFITGPGMDAVVTVQPYATQIATTTLAGRAPGAMAAGANPDYLFLTNSESGNVTVINIPSQRVIAAVTVGQHPCHVTITPDQRYALVLNRDSGDMAVIRISALSGRRRRFAPLFTMIPVGSQPVSAIVRGA